MPIRGIALDAEGVMFDFERDGHHLAHRRVAKELGLELSAQEALELIPNLVGGPGIKIAEQIYDLVSQRELAPKMEPREIYERSLYYFKQLLDEIRTGQRQILPRPGLLAALEEFSRLSLPVVVGSSTWPEEFWVYWEKTGLIKFFPKDKVVLADKASGIRHKPEPDIFLKTAELLGIDPMEQLVIEDSQRGTLAGVAAGSMVVGVTTYDHPQEIIRLYQAGAQRVFCDWREVNFPALIDNLNSRE